MIDYEALRKHIRFTIEDYGTKTRGEPYRYDQVAAYLTELVERLINCDHAINETLENYPAPIAGIIKITVQ